MIYNNILEINFADIYYDVTSLVKKDQRAYLKLEHFNFAGSIKFKTALFLINSLEEKEGLSPLKHKIIESSSGNLGIALSLVCKIKGYHFSCVVDPNISATSKKYIELYGGSLIEVTEKDDNGGYLKTRIKTIQDIIGSDKNYVWPNQYASQYNSAAHYCTTAKEVCDNFKQIHYLLIGTGSTGTIMGCSRYFKEHSPGTKIIAVDPEGSVTFCQAGKKRLLPGIGTSRTPELFERTAVDDFIIVPELETIKMCHWALKEHTLFIGPSSGAVLYGIKQLAATSSDNATIVGISADSGEKYLDTVFDADWVNRNYTSKDG